MHESLYELSTELAIIKEDIADNEGILDDILEKRLDEMSLKLTDKAGGIAKWCRVLDGNIDSIDAEIERLRKRKTTIENLEARLKTYLKDCMERAGMTKLDTGIMVVSVQKNPPSVEITNEETVNNQYKVIKTQVVIDKRMLLEDLKAGIRITGAELVTDKTNLRIR